MDCAMEAVENALALKATPVTIALSNCPSIRCIFDGKVSFPQASILGERMRYEKSLWPYTSCEYCQNLHMFWILRKICKNLSFK